MPYLRLIKLEAVDKVELRTEPEMAAEKVLKLSFIIFVTLLLPLLLHTCQFRNERGFEIERLLNRPIAKKRTNFKSNSFQISATLVKKLSSLLEIIYAARIVCGQIKSQSSANAPTTRSLRLSIASSDVTASSEQKLLWQTSSV